MDKKMEQLIEFRHQLHRYPEISGAEKHTAARVLDFLKPLSYDQLLYPVGGHGILVSFNGQQPGKQLLFRSELDGLPITERNSIPHTSRHTGFAHACGHDGHTAILCGLAKKLSRQKPATGKVHLLFQPAEETGEGARLVVNDPRFDLAPDLVFALHNLPGFKTNQVVLKDGLFTAAVNSIIIHLDGKTTHAAEPAAGISPALAVSDIIKFADSLNIYDSNRPDFQLVTPVYLTMGEKTYGTAAGAAALHFTLRSWNNENLRQLEKKLVDQVALIAANYRLQVNHEFTQTFYANFNDKDANEMVRKAAGQTALEVLEHNIPFTWGEDFGYFTSQFKGCMIGLGAGIDHPALHNPDYDFPDELVESGVHLFYTITQNVLNT